MTSKEILSRAASLIDKNGLARTMAFDKVTGAYCLGAALVEAATYNKKFHEKEYTLARNLVCGHMGLSSSYDALVDWNDDSYVTKKGLIIYKHNPADAVHSLRVASEIVENPNIKEKK